ncbi:WD40-repeat-containing domain protein [Paraphoma chrysanthemicola]|uniref:ASTRA-associated protein 1 n=1 Tax=Paraphoma chrysanthemicola TaxID=798071 RepID=A0A8K0VZL5_9PLEO|nr:WD40-repeat-containing domain protein [Paraphoma chrysanthemicola]
MAVERQASALPPAQPSYILRGHAAQIHSVKFVHQNSRLLTGDADGWVVYWKVETKRALAVWKAHGAAILGTEEWGHDKFITHGRDNSLRVWQLRASDEIALSTVLPAEHVTTPRPKPWLLHTLPVNTLNFCAFSTCPEPLSVTTARRDDVEKYKSRSPASKSILVATPSTDDKKINVYQLPDEKLKFIVPKVSITETGMVMAVKLVLPPFSTNLLVLAGYEGGFTAVHQLPPLHSSNIGTAQLVYLSQPHTQPILAMDLAPDCKTFYTSSADAIIAAHRIPEPAFGDHHLQTTSKASEAEASGISRLADDSTNPQDQAGESSATPESTLLTDAKLSPSDPVSETHAVVFKKQPVPTSQTATRQRAGLSSLLSSAAPQPSCPPPPSAPVVVTIQPAHRTTDTRHAGQQSLRVRSDGRIIATGGWDSRIRIYSTKTLKEVAVLKWHKEGVYAVDFARVLEPEHLHKDDETANTMQSGVTKRETGLGKLQRQREELVQLKHWVVAGAKDGKVSLWEIF